LGQRPSSTTKQIDMVRATRRRTAAAKWLQSEAQRFLVKTKAALNAQWAAFGAARDASGCIGRLAYAGDFFGTAGFDLPQRREIETNLSLLMGSEAGPRRDEVT